MNNPSPLIPQGSMLEQKNKNRTRVRVAVFVVLSIHLVGLMALLMQGCRKPNEPQAAPEAAPPPSMQEPTNPPAETSMPPTEVMPPATPEPVPPPAPPTTQEYVVSKGDTLSGIAKKFSVSIKAIEEANPGIQPTKLQIGQKLMIPAPAANPAAAPAGASSAPAPMGTAGEQTYTVKSGDNLTKIAAQFGTTVKALRSENSLTTDRIKVGQKLKIPASTGTAPAPAPAPPAPNSGM
jgi:LysM repeat protein